MCTSWKNLASAVTWREAWTSVGDMRLLKTLTHASSVLLALVICVRPPRSAK